MYVQYFHNRNTIFKSTRPLELLFRDPWWIITTIYLFVVIKTQYEMTLNNIVRISPRFGIMLLSMLISIAFIICDLLSVTHAINLPGDTGINPFWKFAFVFKCLTDSVILDDFKMALDRLRAFKISRLGSFSGDLSDRRTRNDGNLVETWERVAREAQMPRAGDSSGSGGGVRSGPLFASGPYSNNQRHDSERTMSQSEEKGTIPTGTTAPIIDRFRLSNASLDPGGIVPSALGEPSPKTMNFARMPDRRRSSWFDDNDDDADLGDANSRNLVWQGDYANALRDVEGCSPPQSPMRNMFPRGSYSK
jgi:hypothetical protein